MSANLISSKRSHSIGVHKNVLTLEEIKENILKQVLKLPAILARGLMDHLIYHEEGLSSVHWRIEPLREMQTGDLMMLKNLLENRMEQQQRTY